MSEGLFQGLWLLAIVSIPAAIVCAIFLYKLETARPLPAKFRNSKQKAQSTKT